MHLQADSVTFAPVQPAIKVCTTSLGKAWPGFWGFATGVGLGEDRPGVVGLGGWRLMGGVVPGWQPVKPSPKLMRKSGTDLRVEGVTNSISIHYQGNSSPV